MEYAWQLFQGTGNSLEDIAAMLGYSSRQSFTTAYRNHVGHTRG